MKTNKIQEINDEFNKLFNDEVFMPMLKFPATLIFLAIVLDFGFQLKDAIDTLTR